MVQDSKTVKDAWSIGIFFCMHTAWAPKARRPAAKKSKRSTILPISLVQFLFCVLFFSLCSNLSMWSDRQVVPDGSRCYIPIFDGLVSSDRSPLQYTVDIYKIFTRPLQDLHMTLLPGFYFWLLLWLYVKSKYNHALHTYWTIYLSIVASSSFWCSQRFL